MAQHPPSVSGGSSEFMESKEGKEGNEGKEAMDTNESTRDEQQAPNKKRRRLNGKAKENRDGNALAIATAQPMTLKDKKAQRHGSAMAHTSKDDQKSDQSKDQDTEHEAGDESGDESSSESSHGFALNTPVIPFRAMPSLPSAKARSKAKHKTNMKIKTKAKDTQLKQNAMQTETKSKSKEGNRRIDCFVSNRTMCETDVDFSLIKENGWPFGCPFNLNMQFESWSQWKEHWYRNHDRKYFQEKRKDTQNKVA